MLAFRPVRFVLRIIQALPPVVAQTLQPDTPVCLEYLQPVTLVAFERRHFDRIFLALVSRILLAVVLIGPVEQPVAPNAL